ncbi:hypothetical protein OG429_01785 [Streptomyces sp. NBC_00190]|nr:hypothetical protein [Streptomyces sp. NBC_00190]WSZ38171.1 hypothetical protein OG239_04775 [Streptomyces sp. NBC_00868]
MPEPIKDKAAQVRACAPTYLPVLMERRAADLLPPDEQTERSS